MIDKPIGVQYVSYAELARDIRLWSLRFPPFKYKAICGIPRSGLTCAHMLASQLNIPCVQLGEETPFRQSTGREMTNARTGKILVIDDACSCGTAITEAREKCKSLEIEADFAAVYSRVGVHHLLDLHPYPHREPDHLVVFEWNWMHHQDRGHIAVTKQCLNQGLTHLNGFNSILDEDCDVAEDYGKSNAALLFASQACEYISLASGKPVVDITTGLMHK